VEARTFTERMFHVVTLKALSQDDTKKAVIKPIIKSGCPFGLSDESFVTIWGVTRGYPYFIQFICREAFDVWVQDTIAGQDLSHIPIQSILLKLDSDFFTGRWAGG